jgi:hypothetical protein
MRNADDVAYNDADDVIADYSNRDDKGRGREEKVQRVRVEEGGWTVVQQRHTGQVRNTCILYK